MAIIAREVCFNNKHHLAFNQRSLPKPERQILSVHLTSAQVAQNNGPASQRSVPNHDLDFISRYNDKIFVPKTDCQIWKPSVKRDVVKSSISIGGFRTP